MSNDEKTKIKSQQIRGKNGTGRCSPDSGGKGGTDPDGDNSPNLSQRTDRAIRTGGTVTNLIGGIYAQLIANAERKLGNALSCIQWYERERDEAFRELDELRKQQALLLRVDDPENSEK